VLALGPHLRVNGRPAEPGWPQLLLGGIPGNGLGLPLSADLACSVASKLVPTAPGRQTLVAAGSADSEGIALPFRLLWRLFPAARALSVPSRFAVVALLSLAVLAAAGLHHVQETLARRGPHWATGAVCILAPFLILTESAALPYPTFATRVPLFYHRLRAEPGDFAIVEVPLSDEIREWQYYQTTHQKRLFTGHVSRLPAEAYRVIRGNALLAACWWTKNVTGGPALEVGTWDARQLVDSDTQAQLRAAHRALVACGARYLVEHDDLLTPTDRTRLKTLTQEVLRLRCVWDELGLRAYELAPTFGDAAGPGDVSPGR